MTAGEIEQHREKIRKVMMDHLVEVGFPNLNDQQIFGELKNMWVKIEEAGLILPGMTFRAFQDQANLQQMMAAMHNLMGI